jgi:nucleotidyltransferase DUF2204
MTSEPFGLAATQAASCMRASHMVALRELMASGIPFLVGGAFALERYTRIERETKDLDIFVLPDDAPRVLDFFGGLGRHVDFAFPHWLGKVYFGRDFMDVIFNSGNGVARVDEEWFAHAPTGDVLGAPVRLCPPEEMIWSKAFVQERERFDGADVMHLMAYVGSSLDWRRLHERFGPHWRVLLGHIVTFGFVYPDRRDAVPAWVIDDLVQRLSRERSEPDARVCNGTLLSREQYLSDLREAGYQDARLAPVAYMTPEALEIWNRDIHGRKAR